ncbi:glycosyltransferase family 2 protein [Phenylobacterium sp.]|uniref:glycosyltransferase family 2 protein n=1 Tax=Phenylobacterium sp. TaxID=1871053 RepID=UPI002FE1583E
MALLDEVDRLQADGAVMPASDAAAAPAPLAVVMISLNEGHNMEAVLANLAGFAAEVFLVDSYSSDRTVDIALSHGVQVVQRRFRGFGDQWNYAVGELPIRSPWTMKLDPDERLTEELKAAIRDMIAGDEADAVFVRRRLWFMGRPLTVRQDILRLWRTGSCRFSDVLVNEHPVVPGRTVLLAGDLEHHDSPDLHHWFEKQNAYTTAEALAAWRADPLSAKPRLTGNRLERRMWLKRLTQRLPFAHVLMFFYCYLGLGAWRAGRTGLIWSRLRGDILRWRAYKRRELELTGVAYAPAPARLGPPDPRVRQAD